MIKTAKHNVYISEGILKKNGKKNPAKAKWLKRWIGKFKKLQTKKKNESETQKESVYKINFLVVFRTVLAKTFTSGENDPVWLTSWEKYQGEAKIYQTSLTYCNSSKK